jgi:protein-tyrosine phosphatase
MVAVIDLHTHVLPGVDDGPETMAGSLALAELAAHGGTRTLVATPHLRADHPAVRADELRERTAELQAQVHGRGMRLEVLPGAEVDLATAEGLPDDELAQATLAANGSDLLVESPYGSLPDRFRERLAELSGRGFRLTLAHPERCPGLQQQAELVEALVADGVLLQLTARSVAQGKSRAGNLAGELLRRGWAHVVASDAHRVDWRPPDLNVALRRAREAFPEAAAELEWMVTDAPRAILDGRPLPERPPRAAPRRRRRLFRS